MPRLHVLGTLDLRDDAGREIAPVLAQPKRLAVLAYLAAAEPFGFHRRDTLLALFWPELDDEQSRRGLRQALHFLRKHLGADAIVSRGDEELAVDDAELSCDARDLVRRADAGDAEGALALYQGDLLPGFHVADGAPELDEWLERTRARLHRRATDSAAALAQLASDSNHLVDAARWARRGLELDSESETAARCLIAALEHAGDRAGALRTYAEFEQRLGEQYGGSPSRETRALVATIRARHDTPAELPSPRFAPRIAPTQPPAAPPGDAVTAPVATSARSWRRATITVSVLALGALAWSFGSLARRSPVTTAIGEIEDFTRAPTS
ncbi:MAG: bacterial transcriptional activator domain-containing protein, partial [Gemmatimonadaceae bacterium]